MPTNPIRTKEQLMQNNDIDARQLAFGAGRNGNVCHLVTEYDYVGYVFDIVAQTDDDAAFITETINLGWFVVDIPAYVDEHPYDEIENAGDLIENVLLLEDETRFGNRIVAIERSMLFN